MALPSQFLPSLSPTSATALLADPLAHLATLFAPQALVSLLDGADADALPVDEFERNFARGWVERVLALGMKGLGRGEESCEALVDQAAGLVATLAGHCSAGPSTRTFLLPSRLPPPDRSTSLPSPLLARLSSTKPTPIIDDTVLDVYPLEIIVRDATMLQSGTGFRTWGAATLLARLLSLSPASYFPASRSPLCVLELGSGTGLVGLTASALLHRSHQPAHVAVTDFDPDALSNLAHNLDLNQEILSPTTVVPLDWAHVPADSERHDVVLAADVVYEPEHALLVQRAVTALLAFPAPGTPTPAFHAVLPLRRTHAAEHLGFDDAFRPGQGIVVRDRLGTRWRLETKQRREERGKDGFGSLGEGQSTYWVYRVEWVAVPPV